MHDDIVEASDTPTFEAPRLVEIGSVQELTLQGKEFGPTDGFTFQGQGITNT